MNNKELDCIKERAASCGENPLRDSKYTPNAGAFSETAAWLRELRNQNLIEHEEALIISDRVYRITMLTQLRGFPVDTCIERPEDLKKFPGALNEDGTVRFSKSK